MITTEIIAFGIAKDILKQKKILCQSPSGKISEIRQKLIADYPEFERLSSLKFAVETRYVSDDYVVKSREIVVLIPPVSGG